MLSRKQPSIHSLLLGLFTLCLAASSAFGWGRGHWVITQQSLDAIDEREMGKWAPFREEFKQYCVYPDLGLGNDKSKPYLLIVRGRLFHYAPLDNKEDYLYFMEGATTYFEKIIGEMRRGKQREAAQYAGAFAHVVEDLGQPQCHSMEGINGFSWKVLDELFTPEGQSWNRAPQSIISLDGNPKFTISLPDNYTPRLLGTHPREAAFRLYQRCCQLRRIARKSLPGMLAAVYADKTEDAIQIAKRPALECAKLVADVFHTSFAMAEERFSEAELASLQTMDLTSLVPITVPGLISIPYRFSPLAYGCSVSLQRQPVPLTLWMLGENGEKSEISYAKGIGTGCTTFAYEIPSGVFRELRCTAGLHSQLGMYKNEANLKLSVRFCGKTVFESGELKGGAIGKAFSLPLETGGKLEFISAGNPGLANNRANHAVWAEPLLVRLSSEEQKSWQQRNSKKNVWTIKQPNLLPNASFENWDERGLPVSWGAYLKKGSASRIEAATDDAQAGKTAARLVIGPNRSVAALRCPFTNKPGTRYRLTIHWKSPLGVLQYAIKTSKKGWIAYNGGAWQRRNANPCLTGKEGSWNKSVVDFPAFEEETELFIELCRPGNKGAGYSILLDNISLHELE